MTAREMKKSTGASPAPTRSARPVDGPTDDEIRSKAYEIFRARDGVPGDADSDWYEAERLLRSQRAMPVDAATNVHVTSAESALAPQPVVVHVPQRSTASPGRTTGK